METFRRYCAERHGVFSRAEALSFEVTDNRLAGMLRRGEVVRLFPSVYRWVTNPDTWLSNMRGVALSVDGMASHRAAARLWGLDGFSRSRLEVTIKKSRRTLAPAEVLLHRTTQMGLVDQRELFGVPVTGIGRSIIDIAAVVGPKRLNQSVDSVLRRGLLDWADLYDVLIRHSARGRNGFGPLRRLLDVRYGDMAIPDSRWNRMVGTLLSDAGLPEPAYELEVSDDDGRFIARVDLAYPLQRVAIELDSERWHFNRESFRADPRRKNNLALAGWTVLTFTWSDYADHPRQLTTTVRNALK